MPTAIRYRFQQHLQASARKAYAWCTDFDPCDHRLMGDEKAERLVTCITEGTLLLTDTFPGGEGSVEKQKLVQLYPDQLRWVSTHLTGPNKYSQFIYELSEEGKLASCLTFTGLHIEHGKELDEESAKLLYEKLRVEDAGAWKLLAKALEKDLAK